jgi:manganese/zinc/iron transport system ATP- binding protein
MLPYGGRRHIAAVPNAPAFEAECVSAKYPAAQELALCDVSLRASSGARVALVGPNGAGKSTLLKAAVGLLPILSGAITIYGHPVGARPQRVAYLAQRGELDWRFPITLRRLVLTGRYVHLGWFKRPDKRDWMIADQAIERMGLTDLAERQIGELSGGQQQRALLARALAQDADLLLLDEPLNAVDAATRQIVSDTLTELQHKGKTAIIATHDLDRWEAHFDQALFLLDGRMVTDRKYSSHHAEPPMVVDLVAPAGVPAHA